MKASGARKVEWQQWAFGQVLYLLLFLHPAGVEKLLKDSEIHKDNVGLAFSKGKFSLSSLV